ncbi:5-formyltetrahydrofolate cyclo-ligase [Rubritalea marina]|uniref:5-formyltetrahydrofolate cyclo-ligase n=1 Tax=Rubritalea marina TaxID=361055 RepID=UPI000378CBB6|nr:5-formyltetrahydrofolate cyclo-ligase [Rubritalea marina]
MTTPSTAELKSATRHAITEQVNTLSGAEKHLASLSIVRQLNDWVMQQHDVKTVAIYAALENEPQLEQLHQLADGINFVYPLTQDSNGAMQFHLVHEISELRHGRYGILEPHPEHHPLVAADRIDTFICPGIAFSATGLRLGKGGGYYDRILESRKQDAHILGVAFQCQVLDHLPTEDHDIQMDAVISA